MATKIRLRRTGNRNLALYRIVVADSRSPRDGRFIEILGHYDPRKKGTEKISANLEKILDWINKGAEVSETVRNLLKAQDFKFPAKKRRNRKKSAPAAEEAQVPVNETSEQPAASEETPAEETPAADSSQEEIAETAAVV